MRQLPGRIAAIIATATMVLTVAACSDDTSEPSPKTDNSATTGQASGSGDATGDCAMISLDQVSDAVGQPMTLQAASEAACIFEAEADDGPELWFIATAIGIDPKKYADDYKDLCKDSPTDIKAGDAAWACKQIDPQGVVFDYKKKVLVSVDARKFADDDTAYDVLAKLVPDVKIPTP